jgi:predicted DNA-binding protein with PD1-like motif
MTANLMEAPPGRIFIGRLQTGTDLVEEIERFCQEQSILAAWVDVVGAVRRARYAYYEQAEQRYIEIDGGGHHEISGFVGNVSERDGKAFLHAHATFAEHDGAAAGGHLVRGNEVFVAEVKITELTDVSLVRVHDEETGLALW